jgi:hypothetical protein
MIIIGEPDAPVDTVAADDRHMVSRSIVAFGAPAVTYENVASVESGPPARAFSPTVLRGGIFGGAFPSTSSSERPVQASVQAETRTPSRRSEEAEGEDIDAPAPESPVTY